MNESGIFFGEREKIVAVTSDKLSKTGFKYDEEVVVVPGDDSQLIEVCESVLLIRSQLFIPTIGVLKKFKNTSQFPTSVCPPIRHKNLFNPNCLLLMKSGVNRPKYSNRFLSGSGGISRSGYSWLSWS